MNTYYGEAASAAAGPAGYFPAEIATWQSAVPNEKLSIGLGPIYAAWGAADCGPGAAGENQTGCLSKSLAACSASGVESISIYTVDAYGCAKVGQDGCQIAGAVPPESWWPLLHEWRHAQTPAPAESRGLKTDEAGGAVPSKARIVQEVELFRSGEGMVRTPQHVP